MMLRRTVLLLLVTPGVASAYPYQNLAPAIAMSNLTMQPLIHQSNLARQQARRSGAAAGSAAPSAASFSPTVLAYEPSPALARTTVVEFVERLRGKNPAAADAVTDQFARNDYGAIYKGIVAQFGLRGDNAADVLTAYTVLGWMIATGAGDPGRASVEATRQQIGARLAANPQLASPASRARLGEELKLLFVVLHAGWQAAQKEGGLRQYSDGVTAMFKAQGTDLRRLRLTGRGLEGG